ncbi:MAG TPA: hypothetical protein VG755_22165 [Nannocystaceae bacterium]|nr:hypothetical protein [Nannocystaceae bacterium]
MWIADEGWVVLDDRSFVAHGGQGRVWARGQRAYKVHDDPAMVVPAGKLAELARITDACIVRPLAQIEREDRRAVIGHAMRLVEHAVPWAQLVTRSSRARHGLDDARALALVERLRERVAGLHRLGIAMVDLHSFNVLVDVRTREPWLVDLDGAQTPSFAATAIAPHIADPQAPAGVFGPATDWFAFAITTFELLCGIHPYRGNHPRVHGLADRMRARISVLSPDVTVPPACTSASRLPRAWQDWYRAVLEHGVRESPPVASVARRTRARAAELPAGACGCVTIPGGAPRVLVHADDGALALFDPATNAMRPLGVAVGDVRVDDERVLARCGDRWVEVVLHGQPDAPWASLRMLARIAPWASALWPGCATQTLLGAVHLHVRTGAGARSIDLPELARMRVVDAAAEHDTAVVLASDGTSCHRITVRWDATGAIAQRVFARDVGAESGPRPSVGPSAAGSNGPFGPQLGA